MGLKGLVRGLERIQPEKHAFTSLRRAKRENKIITLDETNCRNLFRFLQERAEGRAGIIGDDDNEVGNLRAAHTQIRKF